MSISQSIASSVARSTARPLDLIGGEMPLSDYEVLVAGAVAHYNGASDTANDASGNGNNGTWTGTPAYADPPSGIAARAFSLSSGNYIAVPSSLNGKGAWTAAGWFRATSLANNAAPFVGSLGVNSYPICRYTTADQKLHFYCVESNNYIVNNIASSTTITTATWYHLVMRYNGTTAQLWLNGVNSTTGGTVAPSKTLLGDTARIGAGQNASATAWVGLVADVVLFDRYLSDAEIGIIYAG